MEEDEEGYTPKCPEDLETQVIVQKNLKSSAPNLPERYSNHV